MTKAIEKIRPNLGPLWLRLLAVSLASLLSLLISLTVLLSNEPSLSLGVVWSLQHHWLAWVLALFFWLLITASLGRIVFQKSSTRVAVVLSTIMAVLLLLLLLMLYSLPAGH
jgi:hypothetical protein